MIQQLRLSGFSPLPWQGYLAASLRFSGWLLGSALAIAGAFVAVMFLLGEPTLTGFFQQLAALSSRYVEATAGRQALFDRELAIAALTIAALTIWFRRAGLRSILNDLKEAHDGRG